MTAYCFENALLKELFLSLSQSDPSPIYSFEELVGQLAPVVPSREGPSTPTENTIRLLRESLILNEEHIGHCFSVLPETPKNLQLKDALLKYLESDLSSDWTATVWRVIGELKEKRVSTTFESEWIFIKTPESSFLFNEFAKAFTYAPGVKTADIRTFGHLASKEEDRKPSRPLQRASAADALGSLADKIQDTLKTSPRVYVPFHGTDDEKLFLKLLLTAKGISVDGVKDAADHSFFSTLRRAAFLPTERRIRIWHEFKMKRDGALRSTTEKEILDHLVTNGTLSVEERGRLLDATESYTSAASVSNTPAAVQLLPWIGLPIRNVPILAFAGETLFEFDTTSTELTVSELETLYHAGFPLPRPSELRKARLEVVLELMEGGGEIYTSLPKDALSSVSIAELPPKTDPATTPERKPHFSMALPLFTYSATQLETYALCPTRYLFGNRLKLRKEPVGMEALALLNGQITHRALENCFSKNGITTDPELLVLAFQEALKEIAPQYTANHPMIRHLRYQFMKTLPGILKLEKELDLIFGKRSAKYFEAAFELSVHGAKFRGKIDRIDELEDGSLLVLDYKTGSIDFTPDHIRKGSHFQGLLYLLGTEARYSAPVVGMLFYDLKNTEIRRGILIEERVSKEAKKSVTRGHTMPLEKYQALMTAGSEQATALCNRIAAGDFEPTPSAENCSYCEFATFCRSAYATV